MKTLFVLMPFIALCMVINIMIGCYVLIQLGYGPPNWQTALNLVVRLTTLQYHLNETRKWLEIKAPWADKFLTRLHVPKPIIFIDTSIVKEDEKSVEENEEIETNDKTEDSKEETVHEIVDEMTGKLAEQLLNSSHSAIL